MLSLLSRFYFFIVLGILATFSTVAQPVQKTNITTPISNVYQPDANTLYLLPSDGGIAKYEISSGNYSFDSVAAITRNGAVRAEYIVKVLEINNSLYAISDSNGIYVKTNGVWSNYTTQDGLASDILNDIANVRGEAWIATTSGISVFNGNSFQTLNPYTGSNNITCIKHIGAKIYVSNNSGNDPIRWKVRFANTWQDLPLSPNTSNLRSPNAAYELAVDDNGTVVIKTQLGELHSLRNQTWSKVTRNIVPLQGQFAFNKGKVYILDKEFSLFTVSDSSLKVINHLQHLTDGYQAGVKLRCLAADKYNLAFWVGTNKGLYKVYPEPKTYAELGVTNFIGGVGCDGSLFRNDYAYQVDDLSHPNGRGLLRSKTLFSNNGSVALLADRANFWFSGKVNGNNRVTARRGAHLGKDYFSGPSAATYNDDYMLKYNRVWKVSKTEIKKHLNDFNDSSYVMPEAIENWPGNGDTSNGEAAILAPFIDVNGNNLYEPQLGDYPNIAGDEAVFFMINDVRGNRNQTNSQPLNVEMHGMLYGFDTTDVDMQNAIFFAAKIYNRGNQAISDFRVSLSTDFGLGNYFDNAAAVDTALDLVYIYNLDNDDEGPNGFGVNPPSIGVVFLEAPMGNSINYFAVNSPGQSSSGSHSVDPQTASDFYNLSTATWLDGNPLVLELPNGDGYTPNGAGTREHFQYNDALGWIDASGGYKTNVSSTKSVTLGTSDELCFTAAYIKARNTNGASAFSGVTELKARAQAIKQMHLNSPQSCLETTISLEESFEISDIVRVFPNPTNGRFSILLEGSNTLPKNSKVVIVNTSGQAIYEAPLKSAYTNHELTCAPGLYIVKVFIDGVSAKSLKMVKY